MDLQTTTFLEGKRRLHWARNVCNALYHHGLTNNMQPDREANAAEEVACFLKQNVLTIDILRVFKSIFIQKPKEKKYQHDHQLFL